MPTVVGCERRSFATQDGSSVTVTFVVAKDDGFPFVTVRCGVGTPEWVAACGDKIRDRKEIHLYFPAFDAECARLGWRTR